MDLGKGSIFWGGEGGGAVEESIIYFFFGGGERGFTFYRREIIYQTEMFLFSTKSYSLNLFGYRFKQFWDFEVGVWFFIIFYFYRYRINRMLINNKKIGQV